MPSYDQARMTPDEARQVLDALGLTIEQAARLLRISARTMRRYFEGGTMGGDDQAIPGPVEQALRAWLALNERGLPWRPDGEPLNAFASHELARLNIQRQQVVESVQRVREAGGPTLPWDIDVNWGVARLGSMSLHFYLLPGGGFVPQSYSRQDKAPDIERDRAMLEDGIASIAQVVELVDSIEPPPILTPARRVGDAYLLWEERLPPRYVVRIKEVDVAALARTTPSNQSECLRFLQSSRAEIAKIADVEVLLRGKRVPDLGVHLVELDQETLAPAGLHRTALDGADRPNGREGGAPPAPHGVAELPRFLKKSGELRG